jgi:hypothetical protein
LIGGMSVSSLSDLSRQNMLSILGYGPAQSGQSSNSTASLPGGSGSTSASFSEMLAQLQQLEQSSPGQYSKVSQQISANLSTAAGKALTQGNTSLASELNLLSTDFASASQSGQLPNVGDLAKAMSGGHHRGVSNSDSSNAAAATAQPGSSHGLMNFIQQAMSLAGI